MTSLLHNQIFRYGLAYLTLFCLSLAVALLLLFFLVFGLADRNIDSTLLADAVRFGDRYADLPVTEIAADLENIVADHPGYGDVYLLADAAGHPLAGNLDFWPETSLVAGQVTVFRHQDDREGVEAPLPLRATVVSLRDDSLLLVGWNYRRLERIRHAARNAGIYTFGAGLLIGLVVAFLMARRLSLRLEYINRTSVAILEGDLSRRMPLSGSDDEFDRLSGNLNRMLDQIQRLLESMRGVTDNIAHDLRSPISRLRSRLEVSLMADRESQEYRGVLAETIEDTDRILTTFNALLTIAKVQSGALRERFKAVDVNGVVAATIDLYEAVAEDREQVLTAELEESLQMTGNGDLLAQALANLVDNAIKYSPDGSRIRVLGSRSAHRIRLAVVDAGPGIPPEFRTKVFERFSRLDASRTTPGQGLGLSLVDAVVRLHRGTVTITGSEPGTRVAMELPIRP